MAIQPPSGPTQSFRVPQQSLTKKQSLNDTPQQRAAEAEKDAMQRVATASKTAEKVERESADQIDRLRDEYSKRENQEQDRQEIAMENQRLKGYERMRDLHRSQQAEISRIKRDGEKQAAEVKRYYDNRTYVNDRDGKKAYEDSVRQHSSELTSQQKLASLETEEQKSAHAARMEQLKADEEAKYQQISKDSHQEYERLRSNIQEANQEAEKKFQKSFQDNVKQQASTINHLNRNANQQIQNIRQDTAHKLAAYGSRQNDPFYKLVDLDADLSDRGDYYELTATIPDHEQQHVSVSLKGNHLVVSGTRRNEEKLELAPGHTQGTSSFQSFNESFPLVWPVEGRLLSKEFEGDTLIVRVPKKNESASYRQFEAPKPERVRVERPQFPENLPHVKHEEKPSLNDPEPKLTKKYPGSSPLT